MIKATIKTLEYYLKECRKQMEVHGPVAGQITVIFDMDGFNLRQYMWRPGKRAKMQEKMLIQCENFIKKFT